jgi:hypothetical protein
MFKIQNSKFKAEKLLSADYADFKTKWNFTGASSGESSFFRQKSLSHLLAVPNLGFVFICGICVICGLKDLRFPVTSRESS